MSPVIALFAVAGFCFLFLFISVVWLEYEHYCEEQQHKQKLYSKRNKKL